MPRWPRPACKARATSHCCPVLRQTPLGVAVVPEVKVIFCTSRSVLAAAPRGASHKASVPGQSILDVNPKAAACCGWAENRDCTPLSAMTCIHWAGVKNSGSGTRVRPSSCVHRSIASQSGLLSARIATGAAGARRASRAVRNCAMRSCSAERDHVCPSPCTRVRVSGIESSKLCIAVTDVAKHHLWLRVVVTAPVLAAIGQAAGIGVGQQAGLQAQAGE